MQKTNKFKKDLEDKSHKIKILTERILKIEDENNKIGTIKNLTRK